MIGRREETRTDDRENDGNIWKAIERTRKRQDNWNKNRRDTMKGDRESRGENRTDDIINRTPGQMIK